MDRRFSEESHNQKHSSNRKKPDILSMAGFTALMNTISHPSILLDSSLCVLFLNQAAFNFFIIDDSAEYQGLRFGDIVGCVNAVKEAKHCMQTRYCPVCDLTNSLSRALEHQSDTRTGELETVTHGRGYNYQITSELFTYNGKEYIVATLVDISEIKRKRALEHIFFHDILNTASCIRGYCRLLETRDDALLDQVIPTLNRLSQTIIDEIGSQRDLLEAEYSELQYSAAEIHSFTLLQQVLKDCVPRELESRVHLAPTNSYCYLTSDPLLLRRVLINMVKNAIEALEGNERVTLKTWQTSPHIYISVHNPGWISPMDQLKIFKRSYSTKSRDRGFGTYSMKLITERYLMGKISFVSNKKEGTVFTLTVPLATNR